MIGKNSKRLQTVVSKDIADYLEKRAKKEERKVSSLIAIILKKELQRDKK